MTAFFLLLRREAGLSAGGGGALLALAFYAGLIALLPMATGAAAERLTALAPGIAWLALATASLLSLDRLFERDFEDGSLDLLALGPLPLEAVALAKTFGQWAGVGGPLALAAPLALLALGGEARLAPLTFGCAVLGGLAFAFLGGVGAALALGSRRGGLLVAAIVLPLSAPPVIFGGGALQAMAAGLPWGAGLLLLAAYTAFAVALGPIAMAAACRNALD
jgi:heme exporter protein B